MNSHAGLLLFKIILLCSVVYAKKDLSKWEFEWGFSGISTFAHLPVVKCLADPSQRFDIGILGLPLDTAVSFRPGARFGPRAIRHASARQTSFRGFNARAGINPYQSWAKVLDCADVPVTPFDNVLAVEQIEEAYTELLSRPSLSDPKSPPKIVSLGGDHTIALPTLRALYKKFDRPISVLHFDAHLDTWAGDKYPCPWESETTEITHGTMFWIAGREGLISNTSSAHAGLRTRLSGTDYSDYDDDSQQGFMRISTDDIDTIGTEGIIKTILQRMGGPEKPPVYLSFDIDVIDPSIAPGTGTPEVGGWTTREVIRILRGIESLNIVAADIVEVSPSYDHAEITALAGAQVVYEIITSIVKNKLQSKPPVSPEHSNRLRVEL